MAAACNIDYDSYIRYVARQSKDFNNKYPFEFGVEDWMMRDPVGYLYFNKSIVHALLHQLRLLNPALWNLRELLKEMEDIWRFNSESRVVLDEPYPSTVEEIYSRVRELVNITEKRLNMQTRVNNEILGQIIRQTSYLIPLSNPVVTGEKRNGIVPLQTPFILPDNDSTSLFYRPYPPSDKEKANIPQKQFTYKTNY